MKWIRKQPCAVRVMMNITSCTGRVQADHDSRGRGLSQKADDRTCVPMCEKHHRERTSFTGVFATWDQATMRVWLECAVTWYQTMYEREAA